MSTRPSEKSHLLFRVAPYVSLLVAALVSLLLLKIFVPPYPPIALLWLAACVANAALVKLPWSKLFWLNAGSAFLLFGLAECYLLFVERTRPPATQEGTSRTSWMRRDDVLGYAPKAGAVVTDRMRRGSELMWDVTYTIDDRGMRVMPRSDIRNGSKECILFFGDSFTFGVGVPDKRTLPYQVSIKSGNTLRVFNLGIGGYGPHQMLAAIEHLLIDEIVDCDTFSITQIIYQGIWQHVVRSSGLAPYDHHGPRYEFDQNGAVIYRGHFDDGFLGIWRSIATQAIKSEVYRRVIRVPEGQLRRLKEADYALYTSIIVRVRDLIRTRYPCAQFQVLFWDTNEDESRRVIHRLGMLNLNLHRMSTILPDYDYGLGGATYKLHPQDGHPNALAYERIADYVVGTILPNEPRCKQSSASRGAGPARRPTTAP